MILKILNFLILVICLFIISEIIRNLSKKKKKPLGGLLFLHSETFMRGIKMIFLGITIWVFKAALSLLEKIIPVSITLENFLGVVAALILSYGLFLIASPIKKVFQKEKEKE